MKLKLYVWKGHAIWWADIAPAGRKRIDGDGGGELVSCTYAETQGEAVVRGLALLDELSVSQ